MNIQDIMLRDIADEERKRDKRDAANMGDECGFPWLAVAVWRYVLPEPPRPESRPRLRGME